MEYHKMETSVLGEHLREATKTWKRVAHRLDELAVHWQYATGYMLPGFSVTPNQYPSCTHTAP